MPFWAKAKAYVVFVCRKVVQNTVNTQRKGLYKVDFSDLPVLASFMANSFCEDPLFDRLLPVKGNKLRNLRKYFLFHLKALYPYCTIYDLDKELHAAMVIFDSAQSPPKAKGAKEIIKESLEYMSVFGFRKTGVRFGEIVNTHNMMFGDWVKDFIAGRYLHIELLYVDSSLKGTGAFRRLLSPLFQFADKRGLAITIETHNRGNIGIYTHIGFEEKAVIQSKYSSLRQYCLIRPGKQI